MLLYALWLLWVAWAWVWPYIGCGLTFGSWCEVWVAVGGLWVGVGLWAYEERMEVGAKGDLFTRGRLVLGNCLGKLLVAGVWVGY